ncbi:hypothetical protein LA749_05535 [Lactobacillus acetotolerans]|uniref:Uncharacterized protein n=1 Tax=Lactobacillus acetotolerans TaxID=1600 RepID=A0A5P5ZK77_9LACO|nr:hypothetical protein LA749_05535 [Lactobacillus acetotolerans]
MIKLRIRKKIPPKKNLKIRNKTKMIKGSVLLSSMLVLTTCLLFLQFYQQVYHDSMENNLLLIEYLLSN